MLNGYLLSPPTVSKSFILSIKKLALPKSRSRLLTFYNLCIN